MLIHNELLSVEIPKRPIINLLDNRPPPPPPKTRKGSNFPLQLSHTRFGKSNGLRSTTIIGTMDGSLGVLIPLDEKMYRRLLLLQQIMIMTIPMPLCLNPKDYRLFKTSKFRMFKKKGVLDGNILWYYSSLDPIIQEELAAAVGVTAYLIKENLHEIEYVSNFFQF